MRIKGILLDIDNTLYDYEKTHEIALDAALDLLAEKYLMDKRALRDFYKKARIKIHKELSGTASSHNRVLYFQKMLEMQGRGALHYTLECYHKYWDTFLNNLEVYDDVYDFLEFIKNRRVCLVSDLTAIIQHRKIQKLRLFDYANFMVTSEEAGREKPHPRIFLLALEKLNLNPESVCMIGDDFEKDILGATKLRIKSYWSNRKNEKRKLNKLTTEFKSFRELKQYLK